MRTVQSLAAGLLAAVTISGSAAAADQVLYGPAPSWINPPPVVSVATRTGIGAQAVQTLFYDQQAKISATFAEYYTTYRLRIGSSQGLSAGNVLAGWSPSSDEITVHSLKIYRGDQTIDVLASQKFQVLQRENELERAVLKGELTAALQTEGLRVGDELEFAVTVRVQDPLLATKPAGVQIMSPYGSPGVYRTRVSWDQSQQMRWQATPDLGQIAVQQSGTANELLVELREPKSAIPTEGAPERYNIRRLIEYSSFASWSEVSTLFAPLYEQAQILGADSELKKEAALIAARTTDPTARALAALRLVQDDIRYVYVGLNGGDIRPASADETWRRRYGDCKAKTVVLLALLKELGISAEAVLVNSEGVTDTDQRLPRSGVFDHVLVRATIAGKPYWLDGTLQGDVSLANLPPPIFRWALPLRMGPSELEAVAARPLEEPENFVRMVIDASAGFDAPAQVAIEENLRGLGARALAMQFAAMGEEEARRAQASYWREEQDWLDTDVVEWSFDEAKDLLILSARGQGKLDWEGDAREGRRLDVFNAGFAPPAAMRRPSEQDQTAPWATLFPQYYCAATTIKLPPADRQWRWDYLAEPVHFNLGGVTYFRRSSLSDGVMRVTLSRRAYTPEISPAQAAQVNDGIRDFDNRVSMVYQVPANSRTSVGLLASSFLKLEGDWRSHAYPCAPPPERGPTP